ncbi:MAG: T9SS type A sorting domain-containing protein [Bacteroidia bacterium]|nr:T9SS type A sorting domain-containing protein [Bacteroidia bacterium]MCO5253568.1 T9SS type A sorting domain-containing protein [Bacteroidota bacterium]MCZ2130662.1 T9SS type A sorting domain-containing protein [Bacteroidia bacterium]
MIKKVLYKTLILFALMFVAYTPKTFAQQPTQVSNEDLRAKIYPSEIKEGYFFITIQEPTEINELDIKIVNLIGSKTDFTVEKMIDGRFRIDLENIPSGIYIVRMTKGHKQSTQRIIVRGN